MIYISEKHGCVYSIYQDDDSDGDYLICHPLNADNTFDPDINIWTEVDEMALLGEEQSVRDEVEKAWEVLRNANRG